LLYFRIILTYENIHFPLTVVDILTTFLSTKLRLLAAATVDHDIRGRSKFWTAGKRM